MFFKRASNDVMLILLALEQLSLIPTDCSFNAKI